MKARIQLATRTGRMGSALIAILWVVAILSLAVFSATQFLFVELESEANASAIFQAELLADRGVAIASHPQAKKGDPYLSETVPNLGSFTARISSEGDRLNLNTLLENAEADRIVLEELFYQWGLRSDEAKKVVNNLIDWTDEDDLPTDSGAERSHYLSEERSNHPFNRPFNNLNEVLLVKDFQLVVAANPGWRSAFTLLSSGPLDLNEAPPELISAACQCPLEMARRVVSTRDGFDQIPGTVDDLRFQSTDEALTLLGIPQGAMEAITSRVSTEDPARRVISLGRAGSISVERSVTVQYTGERGQILSWATRRVQ